MLVVTGPVSRDAEYAIFWDCGQEIWQAAHYDLLTHVLGFGWYHAGHSGLPLASHGAVLCVVCVSDWLKVRSDGNRGRVDSGEVKQRFSVMEQLI